MRKFWGFAALALCLGLAGRGLARDSAALQPPIPAELLGEKLHPGYHRSDLQARHTPAEVRLLARAAKAGVLATLPHWQHTFSIAKKKYRYTIVGGHPRLGGTTQIRAVLVPIRLTVEDFSADGVSPVVLDAAPLVPEILASPIFSASLYEGGRPGAQQLVDAMLGVEFVKAPSDWHTLFVPVVAPGLDVHLPKGAARVLKSNTGALLAEIQKDAALDDAIYARLRSGGFASDDYVVFVTANALEHDAFGYHDAIYVAHRSAELVMTYTSWLFGVDDLLDTPSPDAATLSHEAAETIHDAFLDDLTSVTRLWGDPFSKPKNGCAQELIEVGDVLEGAPAAVQLHAQDVNGQLYTVQNLALLQWFARTSPSTALNGAYSFPDRAALRRPAPLKCAH